MNRTSTPRSRSTTSWICFPIRAAPGSTWVIRSATAPRTSSHGTSGCAVSTYCTPWASMRSAYRPSNTPSNTMFTRRSRRRRTSRAIASSSRCSVSVTTGVVRSRLASRISTSSPNGSSFSCSRAGTIGGSTRPARLRSWSRRWNPARFLHERTWTRRRFGVERDQAARFVRHR